jgi:RHS repeat-associated protein
VGNRVKQTVGVNITQYLLDLQPGLSVVLAETQGANTTRYIHGPTGIHAHKDSANNWEWMIQDGLGTVRGVVDNNAAVLESRLYEPYGVPFGATGTSQTMYGFTGEPSDGNSLLHLRARYYAPNLGVFTALDPFEGMTCTPMSLNRHSWVEGNVVNAIDPSGMFNTRTCTVEYGDYLERIAIDVGVFLETTGQPIQGPNPSLADRLEGWRLIARENPTIDPHRIFPGDVLVLPLNRLGVCQRAVQPPPTDQPPISPPIQLPSAVVPGISGFAEGVNWSFALLLGGTTPYGIEMVYNFATWQRQVFTFTALSDITSILDIGGINYAALIGGFVTNESTDNNDFATFTRQYSGRFDYLTVSLSAGLAQIAQVFGLTLPFNPSGSLSGGGIAFKSPEGTPDPVVGVGAITSASLPIIFGGDVFPSLPFTIEWNGKSLYTVVPNSGASYISGCRVDVDRMTRDIDAGIPGFPLNGFLQPVRDAAKARARELARQYNDRNRDMCCS